VRAFCGSRNGTYLASDNESRAMEKHEEKTQMKAVVLHEYGGPEKLKFEDNIPDPQVSGDTVLIATTAVSVNPIDWKNPFRCAAA